MWPCSCNYHASPILAAFAVLECDSLNNRYHALYNDLPFSKLSIFPSPRRFGQQSPARTFLRSSSSHADSTFIFSITRAITITLFYRISIGTAFHRRKLLFTMLLGYSTNDLEIKRYRRHDRRFTSGEIEGAINVIADIHSRARTISSKVRVSRFSPSRNQR